MEKVVGVRFKNAGKVYYFDPGDLELKDGDKVVVETVRGLEFGEVVGDAKMVSQDNITPPLKQVVRKATSEDEAKVLENKEKEKKAFDIALSKIEAHALPMKLVNVEYTFDNSKIIFFFTSEGRVDFRELVKDLAGVFKTRIELRQIGVRDEAKMVGGLGTCGRPLCCVTFLEDFEPVSIRMAKDQNLSLNPSKISGMCGRLMCCLRYEHEAYQELRKDLPAVGSELETKSGVGKIVDLNVLSGIASVKLDDGTIVNVNVRKKETGDGAYPIELESGTGIDVTAYEDSELVCFGDEDIVYVSGGLAEENERQEGQPDEDAIEPDVEGEPSKKKSAKSKKRSRRSRRKKKQKRLKPNAVKQEDSDENLAEKRVRPRVRSVRTKAKPADRERPSSDNQKASGKKKDKNPSGTKSKRRRRRNTKSPSKPRQKSDSISTHSENLKEAGGR